MKRRTVIKSATMGILASALPTLVPAAPRHDPARVWAAEWAQLTQARQSASLTPLTPNQRLVAMAQLQADHMRTMAQTTHLDADGLTPDLRATRHGYSGHLLGETLAESHDPFADVVGGWLTLDPTRSVVLDPRAHEAGLAIAPDTDGRFWWVLMLGAAGGQAHGT